MGTVNKEETPDISPETATEMMAFLPLKISLPFSWWREGMPRPKKDLVEAYKRALLLELSSLREDLPEVSIDGLFFEGGYLGLFLPDDFLELLGEIRRIFPLRKGSPITGKLFPGSLDMALLSAYQSEGVSPLFFEVPSLSMRECEKFNLPNVMQLLDHTRYLLLAYRFPDWGLEVCADLPGRDKNAWERIGQEILRYAPAHVRLSPRREKYMKDFSHCEEVLSRAGYVKLTPDFYTRAATPPAFLFAQEYLGAGLGAITRYDGFETENTSDLGRYLNGSRQYRNLLVKVREL